MTIQSGVRCILCGRFIIAHVKIKIIDSHISVGKAKQGFLVKAANAYLHSKEKKQLPHNMEVFFDVVSVVFDGDKTIVRFYPQAFIPTYA